MNLFELVFKQMRQRALSTWLTLLSILLGVALATAILILYREGDDLFVQRNYGYEVIVGPPKGSPLQLVLNTVYQIDASSGNVPYAVYEDLLKNRAMVKIAVPYAVGDNYQGHRIIGTSPKLFGVGDDGQPLPAEQVLEYQVGKRYQLAQGRVFAANRFEAVIGSEVAQRAGLKVGSTFKATHGLSQAQEDPDEHDQAWEVVGVLAPTRTAADRVIYIPLVSFYAIEDHGKALEEQALLRAGLPPDIRKAMEAPAPAPAPATAPASAPAEAEHDHEHDHAPAPTSAKRQAATTLAAQAPHDDHADHDHAHEGHAHDEHATSATAPATRPAATTAVAHDDHDDHDHAGHDHEERFGLNPDGTINLKLSRDKWILSAILVKARGTTGFQASTLLYQFKLVDPRAIAVNPASVMREFFNTFLKQTTYVLLGISILVIVVAAVGILVAIYNSVSARMREIAILRALGATRQRILTLICLEAGLIGLIGGLAGLVLGHLIAAGGSVYLDRRMGQGIRWHQVDLMELACLLGVVLVSVLAGLVPALKAYRTPVATNLAAV